MHCEAKSHEAARFSQSFLVEEGQYQYKFRLGAGDWWVCDESKPTVDDGQGNKNNLLEVKEQPILAVPEGKAISPSTKPTDQLGAVITPAMVPPPQLSLPSPVSAVSPQQDFTSTHSSMIQKDEGAIPASHAIVGEQTPEREIPTISEVDLDDSDDEMHSPALLNHEQMNGTVSRDTSPDMGDTDSSSDIDDDDDNGEPGTSTPLLRHETFARPQEQEAVSSKFSSTEAISTPAKTLVKFPTHHAGIIEMIMHTQQRLPADDTVSEKLKDSPESQAVSDLSTPSNSLPQSIEAEEAMLLMIREAEEDEFEREEANGEELDPLMSDPHGSAAEPEDDDFESKISAPRETVEIKETIIIEVIDERKGLVESLLDNVGGRGSAL